MFFKLSKNHLCCFFFLRRMEETVRSLLQNQGILEQTAVDTVDIMKAYKVNCMAPVKELSAGFKLLCLLVWFCAKFISSPLTSPPCGVNHRLLQVRQLSEHKKNGPRHPEKTAHQSEPCCVLVVPAGLRYSGQ